MSTFTITGVGESPEPWKAPDGTDFVAYDVEFDGGGAVTEARIHRKPSSAPPHISEVLENFEIKWGKNGATLKREKDAQRASAPGQMAMPRAKGTDFRTPEQIMRGDAHGKAMHWCDIKVAAGEWKPLDWNAYLLMVEAFYQDIKGASRYLDAPRIATGEDHRPYPSAPGAGYPGDRPYGPEPSR